MPELSVNRTLVKSPPELWSELSDAAALAVAPTLDEAQLIERLRAEFDAEEVFDTVPDEEKD